MSTEITSSDLIPIDHHFKVSAGPGAGKTYWLIRHIKNVLQNSSQLTFTTKVACITYTNTGVEQIKKGLWNSLDRVEVSTIHNFLYKYLVKPYLFLLNDNGEESLVNTPRMDGHDEHVVSKGSVIQWLKYLGVKQIFDKRTESITDAIKGAKWHFDVNGLLICTATEPRHLGALKSVVPKGDLVDYKRKYWEKGTIHHDDVLYFSYRLITEHPSLATALVNKFPYIFIDEFQDTNPLQTAILKLLAQEGTTIGVIGDAAQSIFSFQGATLKDFVNFSVPDLHEYTIARNRRSSEEITDILNNIRRKEGLVQSSLRGKIDINPSIVVGRLEDIAVYIQENKLTTLAFRNDDVGRLKLDPGTGCSKLWKDIFSNLSKRAKLLHPLVSGIECIRQKKLSEGLRFVQRIIKSPEGKKIHKYRKKEIAIELIDLFLENYNEIQSKSITEIFNYILLPFFKTRDLRPLSKISGGKVKVFADSVIYQNMIQGISLGGDSSRVRTIHKAKGAEFNKVLVYVSTEKKFCKFILEADVTTSEDESRLYYVGLSRARDSLFVSVPSLSPDTEKRANDIGFTNIIRLPETELKVSDSIVRPIKIINGNQ